MPGDVRDDPATSSSTHGVNRSPSVSPQDEDAPTTPTSSSSSLAHLSTSLGDDDVLKFNFTVADFPFPVVRCEAGHVIHRFLQWDSVSSCASQTKTESTTSSAEPSQLAHGNNSKVHGDAKVTSTWQTTPLPQFECRDEATGQSVPYTLVCDNRTDCFDSSDEDFCTASTWMGSSEQCRLDAFPCGLDRKVSL
jgi:hypothetical protein